MADDLIVSSGGGTRVAVDELFAEAALLGAASASCHDWEGRVRVALVELQHAGVGDGAGSWGRSGPAGSLAHARMLLRDAADHAERLRRALEESAERYGATERQVAMMWDLGLRLGAAHAGAVGLPLLAAGAIVGAVALAPAAAAAWAGDALGWWSLEAGARRVLADPAFVRLVRGAGESLDEGLLGLAGVPLPLALLLGARQGAPENAATLVGLASALGVLGNRAFVEGPVTVKPGRTDAAGAPAVVRVPPPAGVGELARRVPSPEHGDPQVRVERYDVDKERRFVVYIAGTVEWSPIAGPEPVDLTSDVHGVADDAEPNAIVDVPELSAGAERAARLALEQAGARPGDPVLPVGYSAGGIVATDLARADDVDVPFAVTFGAPSAAADTGHVPVLAVGHEGDVVLATGGAAHDAPGLVSVTRRPFDDPGGEKPFAAHSLAIYRETAARIDHSEAPQVLEFEERIRAFTTDSSGDRVPGERTEWIATREPAGERAPVGPSAVSPSPVSPSPGAR
ncbi:hypothetical protein ABIQ69_00250 [Agromyces sp. G08B096]|uniref:Alpha/beta hydrolase n=1 Tax=Agromyces sp. G08B096 TaxID=3156399 RepID=A0AAU7W9G4_9MICO